MFHEYNSAVLGVSQAVGKLADLAGTPSGSDYGLLSREKDRAKARLKKRVPRMSAISPSTVAASERVLTTRSPHGGLL